MLKLLANVSVFSVFQDFFHFFLGSVYEQIGISVPKDYTDEAAPTSSASTDVIKLFQHTIMKKSVLFALDYWPGDENPLTFDVSSRYGQRIKR